MNNVEATRPKISDQPRPEKIGSSVNYASLIGHGTVREAVLGMRDACGAFETPVTGGNVSFYNETEQRNIPPTPQVGGVGLIDDIAVMATTALPGADHADVESARAVDHAGVGPQVARAAPPPPRRRAEHPDHHVR